MLLRTRIILIVLATVAVVSALLLVVADLRRGAGEARLRELELERLEAAWDLAVAEAAGRVQRPLGAVLTDDALAGALERSDRSFLWALMRPAEADGRTRLNVFGSNGELLYGTGNDVEPRPLVGRAQIDQLLAGDVAPRGPRATEDGTIVMIGSLPVYSKGRIVGALVSGRPLSLALDALHRIAGGRIFAVDRNGNPIYGQADPLWPAVRPLAGTTRSLTGFSQDGRHFTLTAVPIADLTGGRVATLLLAAEVTEAVTKRRLWDAVYGGGIALIVIGALALLYIFLRRHFEALETAVDALHDLSKGGAARYVELPSGNDEIGRIAGAVTVFGGAVREIERSAGQRERRLRRQQRFIRRQMEQLASTLEDDARQALLDELNQIESAAQNPQSAQSKGVNDELGLIALGFSRLATRVSMQQVQLTGLVRDLREALEDKRRLISLQQELEIARTMQLSILPQDFPDLPELDLCARMMPAKEVGGDFYDFFFINERKLALTIADVSGKGIPAAFFMLITRTMLRAIAGGTPSPGPAETMRRLNNLLAAENEQMMFVTVFYGEIDLDTGVFTYCNAGHNPPYRVAETGAVEALPNTQGIALATFPDLPYGEKSVTLAAGDVVVMFTDGVSEAFDAAGVMYGEQRLIDTLADGPLPTSRAGLDRMMDSVATFATGAEQSDDITGLVLHWHAPTAAPATALAAAEAQA